MFDFRSEPVPDTVAAIWLRVTRLVASMFDTDVLERVPLKAGLNLVPHFKTTRTPKNATFTFRGKSAVVGSLPTLGDIDSRFLTIYAAADCEVNVRLDL